MNIIRKEYDGEVFFINKKDSELFERAKEGNDDIYFFIEELEFLRVNFIMENDLAELLKWEHAANVKKKWLRVIVFMMV